MQLDASPELRAATRLRLGDLVFDPSSGELRTAAGTLAELRRQGLAVLQVLADDAGHVVTKDRLLRQVWPEVVVGEDSLVQAVADIRRTLGERGHELVRTVPRRGYMLVPDAQPASMAAEDPHMESTTPPRPPPWSEKRRTAILLIGAVLLVGALALLPLLRSQAPTASLPRSTPAFSIVVLPFEGAASEDAWFADALTADFTRAIGLADGFVIGSNTARTYRGKAVDPRTVARELGVRYVTQGEVRRDGNRVRLNLVLVEGESGRQIATRDYDLDRAELAGSIDTIVGDLTRSLSQAVWRTTGERVARMQPEEVAADDLAMQGFGVFLRHVGAEGFLEARDIFERAVAKDPDSVRGLAGVSLANSFAAFMGYVPDRAASVNRAEEALARLEQVDARQHLTLLSRASLAYVNADWDALRVIADLLVERFPNEPTSHHHRCAALLYAGRFEDSEPACRRAIQISPRDSRVPIWYGKLGIDQFMAGDYPAAIESLRVSTRLNPRLALYAMALAAALVQTGQHVEAQGVMNDFVARNPGFDSSLLEYQLRGSAPRFVAGRHRLLDALRSIGPG